MRQPRTQCIRLLGLLLLIFSVAACGSLPDERQIQRFFGLERTFAHTDMPAPPTVGGYVLRLEMGQTQRIDVREPVSGQHTQISDPHTIQAILRLLRLGTAAVPSTAATLPAIPLQLDFIIGPSERVVTARYDPVKGMLQLYNVPTAAWPDHIVTSYPVAPEFGPTLRALLAVPGLALPVMVTVETSTP